MNLLHFKYILILVLLYTCILESTAYAGLVFYGGPSWSSFAFHPDTANKLSPNYYGLAPEIAIGYAPKKWFSVETWADYIPGTEGKTDMVGGENASLQNFGAAMSFYISKEMLFSIRGGRSVYHLVKPTRVENEVTGRLIGNLVGIRFMAKLLRKRNYFVFSGIELRGGFLKPTKRLAETPEDEDGLKRLDQVRIIMTFMLKYKK